MTRAQTNPREAAWRALVDYDARHPPWEGLQRRCLKGLEGADRGLAAEILAGCLRHRRLIDALLERATDRRCDQSTSDVWNLLRVGAQQILFLDRVPHHAAVNESVELASKHAAKAKGFVNAGLRNLIRLTEGGDPTVELPPDVRHSLPDEIWGALTALLPKSEWEAAVAAMNQPGDLGVRLNPLVSVETSLPALTPHPLVPDCFTLPRAQFDLLGPALEAGTVAVQDAASQIVAHLVAPRTGQRIVDLCAAPGGKSAHLAAMVRNDLSLLAVEASPERRRDLHANLERLGVTCAQIADMGLAEVLMAEPEPDAILVDAPCSGWGTVRHKPDLKWRRRDAAKIAETQRGLLERAAPHLGPGGALIYSVCTFLPAETSVLIEAFLQAHPEYRIQNARKVLPDSLHGIVEMDGSIRTWPHRHACDGFCAVRMLRE